MLHICSSLFRLPSGSRRHHQLRRHGLPERRLWRLFGHGLRGRGRRGGAGAGGFHQAVSGWSRAAGGARSRATKKWLGWSPLHLFLRFFCSNMCNFLGPGLKLNQIGHFCHEFARKRNLHVAHLNEVFKVWFMGDASGVLDVAWSLYKNVVSLTCFNSIEARSILYAKFREIPFNDLKWVFSGLTSDSPHFCRSHLFKVQVVSQFCGHFIGSELHMLPNVSHVPNSLALELLPGMTFTIEPIFIEACVQKIGQLMKREREREMCQSHMIQHMIGGLQVTQIHDLFIRICYVSQYLSLNIYSQSSWTSWN